MEKPRKNLVECFGCGGVKFTTTEQGTACIHCGRIEWPTAASTKNFKKTHSPRFEELLDIESLFNFAHVMARVLVVVGSVWGMAWLFGEAKDEAKEMERLQRELNARKAAREETLRAAGVYAPKPCPPGKKMKLTVTTLGTVSLSGMVDYDIPCVDLTPPGR